MCSPEDLLEKLLALEADLDQEQQEHQDLIWPTGGMQPMQSILARMDYFRQRSNELSEARRCIHILRRLGILESQQETTTP